jgi:hypothetical protein
VNPYHFAFTRPGTSLNPKTIITKIGTARYTITTHV